MSIKKLDEGLMKWYLNEATDTSTVGGYRMPLSPGMRLWNKETMNPYDIKVSKYDDAELAYDSYDGTMDVSKKKASRMEKKAKNIEKKIKNNPIQNDDDGDILNGKTSKRRKNTLMPPFTEKINEDLAVWFGTKKKPKGSKQPKGPWVNICRKKEGGGHPPCGRPEAKDKGYPKCRAAGVASKMTDTQKKSACAQKRRAEKSNPKSGTGNKPKMVSYKPKKNESRKTLIKNILIEYIISRDLY